MFRFGLILGLAGFLGVVAAARGPSAEAAQKNDEALILAIERCGGFVDPDSQPLAIYRFTLAKDGSWELKPAKAAAKKGKLPAADVAGWLKEIKDADFDKLKSNPALGAADEPYMDITVQVKGKNEQKRIRLEEKLSQALEKRILALAK